MLQTALQWEPCFFIFFLFCSLEEWTLLRQLSYEDCRLNRQRQKEALLNVLFHYLSFTVSVFVHMRASAQV